MDRKRLAKRTELEGDIPWDSPATVGFKRKGGQEFLPEIAGFKLSEAVEYAAFASLEKGAVICIWVTWNGSMRLIRAAQLLHLIAHPTRPISPPFSPESTGKPYSIKG